ncbi:DDE-type integrase/transposase/recombinase [Streptomyces sp. NPDC086838]|uniref:DDE-type integrase/transposase/recombinase n=1 Tax=Streptomyces sp. NPDC086838 TaxID=3365762 RepID=UPI00382BC10E
MRRRVRTTVSDPSAALVPDLFRRDFTAPEPGIKYMGDITYLPLENEEFLYLATVLDCFSRKAVGWFIADRIRTDLVADALKMATRTRGGLDGAVFHSDHGAQYGARVFAANLGSPLPELACLDLLFATPGAPRHGSSLLHGRNVLCLVVPTG